MTLQNKENNPKTFKCLIPTRNVFQCENKRDYFEGDNVCLK